jgi:nicotinate phosphoribosyltransferase
LIELSKSVRRILDDAGLQEAKIFATNDLDEHRVGEFLKAGAPIDAFGIGTQLATSADAPALSAVYKLVELRRSDHDLQYTAKFSHDKSTLPAAKQIYRYADHDVVALYNECNSTFKGEPLLRPVIMGGKLIEPLTSISKVQATSQAAIAALPKRLHQLEQSEPYQVEISPRLLEMAQDLREELQPVKQ